LESFRRKPLVKNFTSEDRARKEENTSKRGRSKKQHQRRGPFGKDRVFEKSRVLGKVCPHMEGKKEGRGKEKGWRSSPRPSARGDIVRAAKDRGENF